MGYYSVLVQGPWTTFCAGKT